MTREEDKAVRQVEAGAANLQFGSLEDGSESGASASAGLEPARLTSDVNPFDTEGTDYSGAPVLIGTTKFEPLSDTKNIMITGGGGFIGGWVSRHFIKQYLNDYNIFVFDVMDHPCSLENFRCCVGNPNFKFICGDITNSEHVMTAMKTHNIDTVMHFAAQSHVDLSFGNSYGFTHTNVIGTHVMLECAKNCGIRRFIHVSTDEVYGEVDENVPDLLETSILSPTNPYAASKAAAEMMVNAYYKSFNLPVIIVRSNNVYGPTQYPEKVIPKFALSMHCGKKLFLHGTGTNTRKYLYGQDAADAFDTIFHKGEIGQIYNVGSKDEVSNIDLCHRILDMFGKDNETDFPIHVDHCQDRPFNDSRYAVDGSKLEALGWKQKMPFDVGLRKTVYWYTRWGMDWWGKDITANLVAFPQEAGKGRTAEEVERDKVYQIKRFADPMPGQEPDYYIMNEGKVKQRIIYVGDKEGFGNINGISIMSHTF